jgi:hypothetical protein
MNLMTDQTQIHFASGVDMQDAEGTLRLAQLAAESLHGTARVELEACCDTNPTTRRIAIDTSTETGRTLALVFIHYARCEFGPAAVTVRRARHLGLGAGVMNEVRA